MPTEKDKIKEIIKRQSEQVELVKQRADEIAQTKRTLEENFGTLTRALEKITAIKSNDPTAIALQKVRQSTDSFQRIMEKHQRDLATINPLTGAVRKQRFKTPAITNQVVQSVKPKIKTDEVAKKLVDLLQNKKQEPKKITATIKTGAGMKV